jgi:hypothetical protein
MALVLAAVVSLGGCSVKPKPPLFSLYEFQRLAVVPFANETRDPGLELECMNQTVAQVVRLGAAAVVESAQVSPYLAGLGKDPSLAPGDPDLLKKIGARFKSDVLMTGVVDTYEEVKDYAAPQRRVTNRKTGAAEWGFYTNRAVTVSATAKLLDPVTGSLLWTQRSSGTGQSNEWTVLPIPGDLEIPVAGMLENVYQLAKYKVSRGDSENGLRRGARAAPLMYKRDASMANLRQKAIAAAVSHLTADFKARGNWTPDLRGQP